MLFLAQPAEIFLKKTLSIGTVEKTTSVVVDDSATELPLLHKTKSARRVQIFKVKDRLVFNET